MNTHQEREITMVKEIVDECLSRVCLKQSAGVPSIGDGNKAIDFHKPKELEKILETELQITNEGLSNEEFVSMCRRFAAYSCQTHQPGFMPQLITGIDLYALGASWLLDSLNASSYTYEVGPVFSIIQRRVIEQALDLFKIKRIEDAQNGDGVFCPGASLANMYALMLACHRRFPTAKSQGLMGLPKVAIFTSDASHYSIEKGAIFLGFGLDSVIKVETNEMGIMLPDKLKEAIIEQKRLGRIPLMINATAGTTVLGSFDNLRDLFCCKEQFKEDNIWLHCDAAYGASAIFGSETKHLLDGSEFVDSFTLDYHKVAGVLLQCSLLITPYGNLLKRCVSTGAAYLFQSDKGYDVSYDSGDKSVQCSQKADALKWWLVFKAKGYSTLEREINSLMALSKFTQLKIDSRPGFHLVLPSFQYFNICFWYVPKWMREKGALTHEKLGLLTRRVHIMMREEGKVMINTMTHKGLQRYFRIVVTNHSLTQADIEKILDIISETAESINPSDL